MGAVFDIVAFKWVHVVEYTLMYGMIYYIDTTLM